MDYSTYSGLLAAVSEELDRSDITDARLQSFIRIAELRAFRTLRIPAMETKSALSIVPAAESPTDSTASVVIPTDWLETITLTDSAGRPLEFISQQYFRQLYQRAAAPLTHFTREQGSFLLYPPTTDTEVFLYYYANPVPGDADTNPTPAIYEFVGESLFHGAVSEAWRFYREPEKAEYYKSLFVELLTQLQEQHNISDISGSTLISKNPYQ